MDNPQKLYKLANSSKIAVIIEGTDAFNTVKKELNTIECSTKGNTLIYKNGVIILHIENKQGYMGINVIYAILKKGSQYITPIRRRIESRYINTMDVSKNILLC